MKLFFSLTLPFLLLSCGSLDADKDKETSSNPTGPEEPETPPEELVEEVDDGLDFAVPKTTEKLMDEDDKTTVTGPVPVYVPEPEPDSAIDITPPVPSGE